MPTDQIKLTKNKKALARIIDQHAEREESRLSYRRTTWLLAWYYLNGARRFDVFDPEHGSLQPHYLDEEGNMEFQSQELLSAIDRVTARLAAADFMPSVKRKNNSLTAVRDRSIAQVISNSLLSADQLEKVKSKFCHLFAALGSCGIAGHITDHPTIGLSADLEVIHPRELFPFPSLGNDYTKAQGLMRQRCVPISFLKDVFGKKITSNLKNMEYWEKTAGESMEEEDESEFPAGLDYQPGSGVPGVPSKADDAVGVAKIRELWLMDSQDLVSRYIVTSGDYVIHDEEYEGLEVYCPIGFARFMENGSFHGAGMFDLLFSISRELERLMKSLFNNIREIDKYGVLVMPQGQFNERAMLRDVGNGLRMIPYEPDPVSEGFRPFTIAPHNTGDIPGKTASFAKSMMDGLSPVRDLIEEKGRIDSAAGLNFLDEEVNRAMTNPSRGVDQAFGSCYRSMLSSASRVIMSSPRPLPISDLTLDMAGVIFDPVQGTVSFGGQNPIPNISTLQFNIMSRTPRSGVARKAEALEMLRAGLTDPAGLKILALKENLDFAVYIDEEKAAYESIVRNCLILYGDGETPGEVVVTPHTAMPEMQLRILGSFMASPAMSMSSPLVQDEFMKYRQFLFDSMGMTLPESVPNPDDMASLMQVEQAMREQQMRLAQMQQGGGPGGPPMPFPNQGVA
tara:strand:+ start:2360 stop:4399 length:2040 start_codon:yes stop_codon:yes gene_type:complete